MKDVMAMSILTLISKLIAEKVNCHWLYSLRRCLSKLKIKGQLVMTKKFGGFSLNNLLFLCLDRLI